MSHKLTIPTEGEDLIVLCSVCGPIGRHRLLDDEAHVNAIRQAIAHETVAKSREKKT